MHLYMIFKLVCFLIIGSLDLANLIIFDYVQFTQFSSSRLKQAEFNKLQKSQFFLYPTKYNHNLALSLLSQYSKLTHLKHLCFLTFVLYLTSPQPLSTCMPETHLDLSASSILEISEFMTPNLELSAFQNYLLSGSSYQLQRFLLKQRNFYACLVALFGLLSLALLVVLFRTSSSKLTTLEAFVRLKGKSLTSPISGLFSFVSLALLISTSVSLYLMFSMAQHTDTAFCRTEAVLRVANEGSSTHNWTGIQNFTFKLKLIQQLALKLNSSVPVDLSSYPLAAQSHQDELIKQYYSILAQYKQSILSPLLLSTNASNTSSNTSSNISISIKISELIPTLFLEKNTSDSSSLNTGIMSPLKEYFLMLQRAILEFISLQTTLMQLQSQFQSVISQTDKMYRSFSNIPSQLSSRFLNFKVHLFALFDSSKTLLLVCQVLSALSIIASILSLVSIRLIQLRLQFFSLKGHKLIWGSHILSFCLNTVFLFFFNEITLYSEGMCSTASSLLTQEPFFQQLLPPSKSISDMFLLKECIFRKDTDFTKIFKVEGLFASTKPILHAKKQLETEYKTMNILKYDNIMQEIEEQLNFYRFGQKGTFRVQDHELDQINLILQENVFGQNCFKHRWTSSHQFCPQNWQVKILPRDIDIPYYTSSSQYHSAEPVCFVFSSFPSSSPRHLNYTDFLRLYNGFRPACNLSVSRLQVHAFNFFSTQETRAQMINTFINELYSLRSQVQQIQSSLIEYIDKRVSFFQSKRLSQLNTYDFVYQGNDCKILKLTIQSAYHEFCVSFRAKARIVYLLLYCHFGYSILLVVLSFFYAYQLGSLSSVEEQLAVESESSFQGRQGRASVDSGQIEQEK